MPVVRMPNGDLVRFPNEMPKEQISQFIEAKFPNVFAEPERKSTVGEEFLRGLQTTGTAYRTAAEATLGKIIGDEDSLRDAGIAGIERGEAIAEKFGTPPGLAPVQKKYEEEGLGAAVAEALGQTPRAVAQQSGPIAAFVGGAKLGAKFMPVPALKPIAGIIGGSIATAPQFLGFNLERQIQAQTDEGIPLQDVEIDYDIALKTAVAQGAVESFGQAFVLGKGLVRSIVGGNKGRAFAAGDKRKLVASAKRSLPGAAGRGFVAGQAEMPVEVAQQILERNQANLDVFSEDALAEYGEAAFLAGTVGGSIGTVGGVAERSGSRRQLEAQEALEEEKAARPSFFKNLLDGRKKKKEEAAEQEVEEVIKSSEAKAKNTKAVPTDVEELKKWGMDNLGIGPTAAILKPDGPIAGKDLTDPQQNQEVIDAITVFRDKLPFDSTRRPKLDQALKYLEDNKTVIGEASSVEETVEETVEEAVEETVEEPVIVAEKEQSAPETEVETEVEALRRKATGFQTEKDTTYEEDVAERNAVDAAERQRKFEALQEVEEVEEDIPQTKPLWSKDLLGFLSDNFAFSQEQFDEVQNLSEDEMQTYLDVIENNKKYRNLKFDGPLVEDTSESIAESIADDSTVDEPSPDGSNTLKDDADAKVVFDQLGIDEAGSFELSTAEFNARLKEANDRIKVIEEAAKKAKEPVTSKPKDGEFLTRKEGDILVDESAKQRPIIKSPTAKKDTPKKFRVGQDKLFYNNKTLARPAAAELNAFKAANPRKEDASTGAEILANYLDAYDSPEAALAVIAAEVNPSYSENTGLVLTTTPEDAAKAKAYINKSMGKEAKQALANNENFIVETLADVQRRNAKVKEDEKARKVSKFGRDKKTEELKDVGAGAKGARAVAKEKKNLVGETPTQIAKRIEAEEKARRDEEATSLAGQKEGTTGTMGAEIRNAEKIARRTEETLAQKARSDEWIAFVKSLPAKNQKAFLDSYKKIADAIADPKIKTLDGKPKPFFLLPESMRARVIAENKKGLSATQKKRLVKFEEKFLLVTPEYQGPKLDKSAELDLAGNQLTTAIKSIVNARNDRGEDKNVTSLIQKIESLTAKTGVVLNGPDIKAANLDPLPSEALEVQAGVEGKSAIEAAKFVAKNAPNRDLRVIAEAIQNKLTAFEKAGMPVDFKVLHLGDSVPADMQTARGYMDPKIPFADGVAGKQIIPKPLVRVNGADITGKVGVSYEIVTHELYHAVTSLQILNIGNINDAKTNEAVADLRDVAVFVRDKLQEKVNRKEKLSLIEKQIVANRINFLDNIREFVTWAMTNPAASAYLQTIPYKKTNAFSAFVRIMRNMIGLPESANVDTALSETIRVTEVILGKNAVNAAMRKAQKIEGAGLAATELPNFASGAYVPGLNTIVISTTTGLNEHTVLHESAHAALAQILDKPNHPVTKKFLQFFADVKPKVGDAYGGTNIQEFAAEFVSNGEFQAILQRIKAPKSENMFVRILQTILEAFGIRKSQSAYDVTLKFLGELLDVSQGVEPTLADTLYLTNKNMDEVIDDTINDSTDSFVTRNTDAALDTVSKMKDDKARVFALGAASLANMDNMYGENSPRYRNNNPLPIGRLMSFIERKRGEVNTAIDRTSKNIRKMTKAEKNATPAQKRAFNDFAIDARLQSIDIFKAPPKGVKRKLQYRKLKNRYNNLPKGLQESYKTLRTELDTYLKEYVELITEILPETSAKELMKNFVNLEGVVAYVPFERSGEYYYRFKDPANLDEKGNPKDTPVAAESPRKRDIAVAALKKKYGQDFEVQQYDNIDTMGVPKGLPEGQFVTKLVGEMRNNNIDSAIIDQVYQQYVAMFPEKSIMQQFKKSKNLPGMDRDIIGAYSNVSIKWANKIANTRYNSQIETAMQEIRRTAKEYHGDNKSMMAASKALTKQEDFFLNPTVNPIAAGLTFASYFEYILGSLSSAVVNVTGLVFMVTPMLGARTTYPKALAALQEGGRLAAGKAWRDGKLDGPLSKYKNMYTELDNRGLLKHTVAREALERGKTKGKDFDGTFYKAVELFSTPFAASERYMRGATAIAAYDLAMKNGIPSEGVTANNEQAAIDFAAKMVRDAHTGGMAETMPRWMQNSFGRVAWTFKNIVFQQTYVVATSLKQAFIDSDLPPEVKRAARRQVVGTFGLSYVLLGAKGLPFFGGITVLMDMLNWVFGDDEDEEPYDARVELQEIFGDYFYTGLIGSVANINISERAALGRDIFYRDDPKSIEDYGVIRTIVMGLTGPMGSYFIGAEKALRDDLPAGRYAFAAEGLTPTFVRNGIKSYRYMVDGARNRDGDPIDTDINAWNLMTQAIGFTPADLSNTYEQRSSAKNFENKVLARKQNILNKYKTARKLGNRSLEREAVKEALAFRRQFPTLMDDTTLERSYKASVRIDSEDTIAGITFTKGLRYRTDEFFE